MVLIAGAFALVAGGQALAADLPQPGSAAAGTGHLRSGPGTGVHLDRHLSGHQRRLWFRRQQLVYPRFNTDWQLQHRRLPRSAARSAAITSGASSCLASRLMVIGRTSMAPRPSPLAPGAALVAQPRVTGLLRCAAAPAMRLTASWSMGRAAPPSAMSKLLAARSVQQLDADRLDRRRRYRIRLHAEPDGKGRIPLRRSGQPVLRRWELRLDGSAHLAHFRLAHREHRPRRHQLQILVTGLGSKPPIRQSDTRVIQTLVWALTPLLNLRWSILLPWVTIFLMVVLDEGKSVSAYARALGVKDRRIVSRYLRDIGERARNGGPGLGLVTVEQLPTHSRARHGFF